MNDKDKEAFEKWWGNIYSNQIEWRDWQGCDIALNGKEDMRYGWQAACLHKQKEIDELIKQLKHEHDLYKKHLKVYEDENAKLREQDQILGEEIKTYLKIAEKLQVENVKLRECVEFYADIINWDKCGGERIRIKDDDIYPMNNLPFGGKRARQILKELEDK